MAGTVVVNHQVTVTNGTMKDQFAPGSKTLVQTAQGGPTPGFVTVGTGEENTAFPELTTLGWLVIENLDTVNYIKWGFATGVYGGRVEPGDSASFRLEPGTTLYYIANSAACKASIRAYED